MATGARRVDPMLPQYIPVASLSQLATASNRPTLALLLSPWQHSGLALTQASRFLCVQKGDESTTRRRGFARGQDTFSPPVAGEKRVLLCTGTWVTVRQKELQSQKRVRAGMRDKKGDKVGLFCMVSVISPLHLRRPAIRTGQHRHCSSSCWVERWARHVIRDVRIETLSIESTVGRIFGSEAERGERGREREEADSLESLFVL